MGRGMMWRWSGWNSVDVVIECLDGRRGCDGGHGYGGAALSGLEGHGYGSGLKLYGYGHGGGAGHLDSSGYGPGLVDEGLGDGCGMGERL